MSLLVSKSYLKLKKMDGGAMIEVLIYFLF